MSNLNIKISVCCIFVFLSCFLCSFTFPGALPNIDPNLTYLTHDTLEPDSDPSADNDNLTAEKIASLTALIVMYSEQLEEYDRSNGTFVVGCITLIGATLGVMLTLNARGKKRESSPNLTLSEQTLPKDDIDKKTRLALTAMFMIIPSAMTLCLYVFSMQCRRVAFFRGYLSYLEKQLSELIGTPMIFNQEIVGHFFGNFTTNQYGPLVMGIFIIVILIICSIFLISLWLPVLRPPTVSFESIKCILRKLMRLLSSIGLLILILGTFFLCAWFCFICASDLIGNGGVPYDVYNFSMNIAASTS